jgi:hypothetical protein
MSQRTPWQASTELKRIVTDLRRRGHMMKGIKQLLESVTENFAPGVNDR